MSWSDSDDGYENEMSKISHRKSRTNFTHENEEHSAGHRQKRSSKRSHRRKTHKDEFWEGTQR